MKCAVIVSIPLLAACSSLPIASADPPRDDEAETAASPSVKVSPACDDDLHHAFDFWVGEWDVYDGSGKLVGTNSIQPAESGCLLVEHWVNSGGGTGQSYNFYDPADGKWRQLWVSSGAVIDYSGGSAKAGEMRLEGSIHYQGTGRTAPFTGEWTLNADGSVTQHFREQDTESGEWADWFVGRYVRKPGG